MRSSATFQQIVQRLTGIAGGLTTCLTLAGTLLQWFEKPLLRWVAWAACASLFAIAGVATANQLSSLVDSRGNALRFPSKWRRFFYVAAGLCLLVGVVDAERTLMGSPLQVRPFENLLGSDFGYTPSDQSNPLLSSSVKNIWSVKSEEDYRRDAFDGVWLPTTAQRRSGVEHVLIHECSVRVEKFEEMPGFVHIKRAAGMADALEASFFLRRRNEPLPWSFPAEYVRSTQDSKNEEEKLPYVFSDDAPRAIRFCIDAEEPGIYWISCSLLVSNGLGCMSTIRLTETAVPIAFYAEDATPQVSAEELADPERWTPFP